AETAGLKRQTPDFPAGQPAGGSAGGERGRRISSPDFLAADPDQGDNSRLTYRLESDDDEFSFALENSNRRPVGAEDKQSSGQGENGQLLAPPPGSGQRPAAAHGHPVHHGTRVGHQRRDAGLLRSRSMWPVCRKMRAKNTPVVTVRAVDGDQGANGRVSYRISPG
uniref:Cadherin domain-containing protein n=1 Tax=Macrostomum lignano TaxID=282301 RepID=A0A1I8HW31_9PLAT